MKKSKAYRIAIRAILTALIILQTMIPFLGWVNESDNYPHYSYRSSDCFGNKRWDVCRIDVGTFHNDSCLDFSNDSI